jgi:hypothetical protein
MHDHPSHWKYTITKYKIQVTVPTNTRVVLYAHPVKLFAHTHTQTLLLKLLSFTDVDNNTVLHLYFPWMIYTHLHYTYMDMILNLLVLWFWCTLQIFLNANFSFTASHSLFKNCSPHLFVPKQLKQREWHSPHECMLDSPIHLTPQPPQFPNHHCEPYYPTSLISNTIWYIILPSPLSFHYTAKR